MGETIGETKDDHQDNLQTTNTHETLNNRVSCFCYVRVFWKDKRKRKERSIRTGKGENIQEKQKNITSTTCRLYHPTHETLNNRLS